MIPCTTRYYGTLSRHDIFILGRIKKVALEIATLADKISLLHIARRIIVVGVIAWIPNNKTLIVVGYALAPVYIVKMEPYTLPPPPWRPIPLPFLRVFRVDISNATVIGKPRIGINVVVIGTPAGIDPETRLPTIKAEKVIVGRIFVILSYSQS